MLNQDRTFDQLNEKDKLAFSNKQASKVMLNIGTSLFRFTGHTHISEWWVETKELPGILMAAQEYGKGFYQNKGLYQYIRERLAVLRCWDDNMCNLLVVKLTKSVYAFRGLAGPQNEAGVYMDPGNIHYKERFTKAVIFKGGSTQVFIPGLNPVHINFQLPFGLISVYNDIDYIFETLKRYNLV